MSNSYLPALTDLAVQTPVVLVYLAGVLFALVFWRRSPRSCLLVLLGCALLLLVTVGQTFAVQFVVHNYFDMDLDHRGLSGTLFVVGLMGTFLRALGLGLLLTAAFVGRGPPPWTAR